MTLLLGLQLNRGGSSHCVDDDLGEHRCHRLGPTTPCWKGVFMNFETHYNINE